MGCIIKIGNQSVSETDFLNHLNKIISVNKLFEENSDFSSQIYEALGFNQELAFVKSDNTIDDDFYIKDELIVTKELQNIRTTNWDGSINMELSKLKNKLNQLPIGSKFNISEYTKPTITSLEEVLNRVNLSESNRVLLEKIKPLIENVKIEYVDKFILSNSGAVYSDKYNTIRLNRSEKSIPLEELLMHELLHAATFRKISYFETNTKGLSKKELAALNELENIRKVLKEASDKYWDNRPRFARSVNPLEGYKTDSIHEIISYAFTNKEFRDVISEIPYEGNKSIFDKLIELIANIFGVKQDTVLNALLANAEVLLENNQITPQQKQDAQRIYSQYLDSLNKPNTNPILQNNQQEQVKKFVELQERLNNKEFLEGAKNAYESSKGLQELGTQEEYNDYIARVSLGIIKNPSSGEYNYTSKVKDIVYHGTPFEFDSFKKPSDIKENIFNQYIIDDRNPEKVTPDAIYFQFEPKPFRNGKVIPAIINSKELIKKENYSGYSISYATGNRQKLEQQLNSKTFDALDITPTQGKRELLIFEPEQIHVMGGKNDINGFKDFMSFENSEFSKYGTYQQFRDYIMSKNFAAIEEFLVVNNKIDRKC